MPECCIYSFEFMFTLVLSSHFFLHLMTYRLFLRLSSDYTSQSFAMKPIFSYHVRITDYLCQCFFADQLCNSLCVVPARWKSVCLCRFRLHQSNGTRRHADNTKSIVVEKGYGRLFVFRYGLFHQSGWVAIVYYLCVVVVVLLLLFFFYLQDCCVMCAGALMLSRIGRLHLFILIIANDECTETKLCLFCSRLFYVHESRAGSFGTPVKLHCTPKLNHNFDVYRVQCKSDKMFNN